jgi:hypothetical protein
MSMNTQSSSHKHIAYSTHARVKDSPCQAELSKPNANTAKATKTRFIKYDFARSIHAHFGDIGPIK